jgi:hypothetical protein
MAKVELRARRPTSALRLIVDVFADTVAAIVAA